MRDALRGLTTRGRAFLAAGATTIVCAVVLGQPALTRVGVLVLALPLVTAVVVGRTRYRLSLRRSVRPRQVAVGQPAAVELSLTNEGRAPRGTLMLEERLPYALGPRPRFVLDGLSRGWSRQVDYTVRSDVRGYYEIGPMSVRVGDPFGLVEVSRDFSGSAGLTVTPQVVPLPAVGLGGGWSGAGENRPRAFATGSAEDVTVREYRRGDDLRRVHWRSSARVGELMVRREEQPWQARATVLLDNRALAHRGSGAASSLETAVTAAASVAVHLARRGFSVRLVTATGESIGSAAGHDRAAAANVTPLLDSLAVAEALPRTRMDGAWLGEHAYGGVTVAVLGALAINDRSFLRRVVLDADLAAAMVLDVDAWGGARPAAGAADADAMALVDSVGWKAVRVGPRDRLPTVWTDLSRTAATSRVGAAR